MPASCTTIRVHMEVADMNIDKNCSTSEKSPSLENIRIQLNDPMLCNLLVNEAIKRLLDDVDFERSLHTGKMKRA